MFFMGTKTNIGLFSHDNTERLVANYMENTKKLSKWHWKQILKSCGAEYEKDAVVPWMSSAMHSTHQAVQL
jgi:hypothetical protein